MDGTHKNVDDYRREYQSLAELGRHYRLDWIDRDLFMDGESSDPDMKRYIEILVERAPERPVLQFDRADFRLPWLRRTFPHAKIVHIYRHPRDQWCSTLMDFASYPKDARPEDFPSQDKFYLHRWARDLRYQFPFLEAAGHPYRTFYYLWRLSWMFGRSWAEVSLAFEDIDEDSRGELEGLFSAIGAEGFSYDAVAGLFVRQPLGKWRAYASPDWFEQHEAACEAELRAFFAATAGLDHHR